MLLSVFAGFAFAQPDTQIVPVFSVAPQVFQTGVNAGVSFTILNANPNSTQSIQNGDQFVFTLNLTGGLFNCWERSPRKRGCI